MLGGLGLLAAVLLAAGLGSALGLGGPSSTTAADYTTSEVREIIRLLREDTECRDTRVGRYFELHTNSLELWQRVLGEPSGRLGSEDSPRWTFRTKDGALTVGVGVDSWSGEVPFVTAYANGRSVSSAPDSPVDTDRLKSIILSIKGHIDPGDSLEFAQARKEEYERELADQEAQRAEQARQDEIAAAKQKEELKLKADEMAAWHDYYTIKDGLPFGSENDTFPDRKDEWIRRRAEALTVARQRGTISFDPRVFDRLEYAESLPLPSIDAVVAFMRAGKPAPVLPVKDSELPAEAVADAESQRPKTPKSEGDTKKTIKSEDAKDAPKPGELPSAAKERAVASKGGDSSTVHLPKPAALQELKAIYRINIGWKQVFRGGDQQALAQVLRANPEWRLEGVAFFGFLESTPGTIPFHRYARPQDGRHTYLVGDQQLVDGFQKEGEGLPMLWIWPNQQESTVPLYLMGAPSRDVRTLAVGQAERDRLVGTGKWREHRKLGFVYPPENADVRLP